MIEITIIQTIDKHSTERTHKVDLVLNNKTELEIFRNKICKVLCVEAWFQYKERI